METGAEDSAPLCTRDHVLHFETNFTQSFLNTSYCGCPTDCGRVEYRFYRDSVFMDPEVECQDMDMLMAAYSRVNLAVDEFHWIYWRYNNACRCATACKQTQCFRQNRWLYAAKGVVFPVDVFSRCVHKVSQDFARVTLDVHTSSGQVDSVVIVHVTGYNDILSSIGEETMDLFGAASNLRMALGGNFGLFIGFSLTTAVEIVFWLYNCLRLIR